MRHFRAGGGAAFLSSRFMRGPRGHQAGCVPFPSGVCAPSQALAPGAGVLQECSAAVGVGGGGGWTQESPLCSPRHSYAELLLRAQVLGHLSPGTAAGTRWGTKVARTLTPDPAERLLCTPSGPAPVAPADGAAVTPQCLASPPGLQACPRGPFPPFWGEAQAPWGGSETSGRRPGIAPG